MTEKTPYSDTPELEKTFQALSNDLHPQVLADLRALVSIAVWIRSEQMLQKNVQRWVLSADPTEWDQIPMPLTMMDTRNLSVGDCAGDQAHAIWVWTCLNSALETLGKSHLKPSWRES